MALTERAFTIPEIMLVAGTRVALGVGVGLLLSDRLNEDERKAAGWALLAGGALTTRPLESGVLAKPLLPLSKDFGSGDRLTPSPGGLLGTYRVGSRPQMQLGHVLSGRLHQPRF